MKATIYIPEEKAKIYEDAKEKLGESISKTFLNCLERELENARLKTERIVVEINYEQADHPTKKAFEGRFIVGTLNSPFEVVGDPGLWKPVSYAVAITRANRLVVLTFDPHEEEYTDLAVHEDFEEFKNQMIDNQFPVYPESLIHAVAAAMDIEHIEDLDI